MIVQAYLERKPESLCTVPCQVEKVVELSAQDFDAFVFNPLAAREFIAENKKLMRSEGIKNHCLLVLGRDRADGVLVNSEGTDQVRYAAYLPCARIIVNAAVEQAAEWIVQEGMKDSAGSRTFGIRFSELQKQTGLVVSPDNGIGPMLLEMLKCRSEIENVEMGKKGFHTACCEETVEEKRQWYLDVIMGYLGEHHDSSELYEIFHDDLGMTREEIEDLGIDLSQYYKDKPGMAQPQL